MSNEINNLYEFGDYVLNAKERNLWRHDQLIQMPPKVFDTLALLVEGHGQVISKEEMLNEIWVDSFVEENNLSQNISALRRIFGKRNKFIETIPRKGFRFAAQVKVISLEQFQETRSHENEEGNYLVATQTQTRVVEETTIQDISEDRVAPAGSLKPFSALGSQFFFVLAAVLITSFLGVIVYNLYGSREKGNRAIPSASFDYVELTDTGNINSSSISPDGKFAAFLKSSDDLNEDRVSLHLMDLESENDVEVRIEGGIKPGFIKFSPDGKSIYFRTRGKPDQFENVYRISKFGGLPKLILKNLWGFFSLSPDGKKMTYFARNTASTKYQIVIRDIESGKKEIILERPLDQGTNLAGYPVFSPNSERIAYLPVNRVENHTILSVVDLKSRKESEIKTDFDTIRSVVWNPDGKNFYVNAKENGKQYQIWSLSYPDGEATRVTSDSNAYRSLNVSDDGKIISANRLNLYSNIWILPEGDISRARQLTRGENEIGGLLTTQFSPDGRIIFNAREGTTDGIWIADIEQKSRKRLIEKDIGVRQFFGFSQTRKLIYFEFEKDIWQANSDGTGMKKILLGKAVRFSQPTVSPDDKWLYYVKRENDSTAIWRKPLEGGKPGLVIENNGYSPEAFLTISPDGKYLAFIYVTKKKLGDDTTSSRNQKRFGFIDLENPSAVKIIGVPSHNSMLAWTNGGKSFDFPAYTKTGSAVMRKNIDDDSPLKIIVELDGEIIYRFDWDLDEENLAIARGNHKMDLVILKPKDLVQ